MGIYKIYDVKKAEEIRGGYFEIPYTAYRDGVKISIGTEDFTAERRRIIKQICYEAREAIGRIDKGGGIMRETCGECVVYAINEKAARSHAIRELKECFVGRDIRIVKLL